MNFIFHLMCKKYFVLCVAIFNRYILIKLKNYCMVLLPLIHKIPLVLEVIRGFLSLSLNFWNPDHEICHIGVAKFGAFVEKRENISTDQLNIREFCTLIATHLMTTAQ